MSDDSRTLGAQPQAAGPRRLIVRNFLSLTVASLAGRVVSLFSGIYVRRVLEVVVIGQIGWCSAVMSYFSLAINPGLETIAKRDVSREPSKAGQYVSVLLTLQLILAVGGFMFAAGFAALGLRGPQISLILALQAIGLLLTPFNLTWLLQANERMGPAAFAEVVSQLLMLPALFLFIHSPTHVVRYVLLAYPFRIGVIVYLAWYADRNHLLRLVEIRPTLHGAWHLLKQAIPLGLSQGAILLYYNFDAIFLGFARGDVIVGLYSTAYNLMLMPILLSGSLTSAYFPSLSRAHSDHGARVRVSGEFYRILTWMGFPLAALGWAFGRHVVALMYGSGYEGSGPIFEWLSLNLLFVFSNIGMGTPLLTWGRQMTHLRITTVGALANVGLNFLLIPRFGAWGAVATTILSEAIVMVGCLIVRRDDFGMNWLALGGKPLVCSVLIGSTAKWLTVKAVAPWWAVLGASIIAFALCMWLTEKQTICRVIDRYRGSRESGIDS